MLKEFNQEVKLVRIVLILAIIALGSYVLGLLWKVLGDYSDVIVILITAWILSFVLEPLAEGLGKFTRLPKAGATGLTYLLVFSLLSLAIFLLIPSATAQIDKFSQVLPERVSNVPPIALKWISSLSNVLDQIPALVPVVSQVFLYIIVMFIISFYFTMDRDRISKEILYLVPKKWHTELEFIQGVVRNSFSSFLRVQVIFGLLAGLSTWVIMLVFQLEFATPTAVLSGLLAIIPFVGPVLAIIPPVFVAFVEENATIALFMAIGIILIQQVIFNIIGPRLLGKAFNIHPVIVLLSFIIGYKLAGGLGLVFAVPVLGILIVVFKELGHHFIESFEKK